MLGTASSQILIVDDAVAIVHGVMPAIGAAAVYRRFKAGTEGAYRDPTATDTPRHIMTAQPDMQAIKLKLSFTYAYEKDQIRPVSDEE